MTFAFNVLGTILFNPQEDRRYVSYWYGPVDVLNIPPPDPTVNHRLLTSVYSFYTWGSGLTPFEGEPHIFLAENSKKEGFDVAQQLFKSRACNTPETTETTLNDPSIPRKCRLKFAVRILEGNDQPDLKPLAWETASLCSELLTQQYLKDLVQEKTNHASLAKMIQRAPSYDQIPFLLKLVTVLSTFEKPPITLPTETLKAIPASIEKFPLSLLNHIFNETKDEKESLLPLKIALAHQIVLKPQQLPQLQESAKEILKKGLEDKNALIEGLILLLDAVQGNAVDFKFWKGRIHLQYSTLLLNKDVNQAKLAQLHDCLEEYELVEA